MKDVVIAGLGQMGAVFAHALLRAGHSVHPVNRGDDPSRLEVDPAFVLLAVGEGDLDDAVAGLPASWRPRIGLLQNELLPGRWEALGLEDPTVAVVWFEKKKTIATNVILPTPVAGPWAEPLVDALRTIDVAAETITRDALPAALVAKNVYILTANLGGLAVGGGTVAALWKEHRETAEAIAREAIAIQSAVLGAPLDAEALLRELERAFLADPDHGAMGRSAPARLERALAAAEAHGVDVPAMRAARAG